MHITKTLQARASVVLLAIVCASACGASIQRTTAIASEQLSASTVRLKDHIEAQFQAGQLPEPDYRMWKRGLGRVARAGLALNAALRTSDGAGAETQVRAIVEMLDELLREDVIRLPASMRPTVTIVMETIRTTLLVISSAL